VTQLERKARVRGLSFLPKYQRAARRSPRSSCQLEDSNRAAPESGVLLFSIRSSSTGSIETAPPDVVNLALLARREAMFGLDRAI